MIEGRASSIFFNWAHKEYSHQECSLLPIGEATTTFEVVVPGPVKIFEINLTGPSYFCGCRPCDKALSFTPQHAGRHPNGMAVGSWRYGKSLKYITSKKPTSGAFRIRNHRIYKTRFSTRTFLRRENMELSYAYTPFIRNGRGACNRESR
jgi:hypothetical protein